MKKKTQNKFMHSKKTQKTKEQHFNCCSIFPCHREAYNREQQISNNCKFKCQFFSGFMWTCFAVLWFNYVYQSSFTKFLHILSHNMQNNHNKICVSIFRNWESELSEIWYQTSYEHSLLCGTFYIFFSLMNSNTYFYT